MKRMILIAATVMAALMTSSLASAQDKSTTPPPVAPTAQTSNFSSLDGARFEIVVPKKNADEYLYRIDKVSGEVWLVYGIKQYMVLQRDATNDDIQYDNTYNYQLYAVDGSTAYLLNLNTGVIWEYYNFGFKTTNRMVLITPR